MEKRYNKELQERTRAYVEAGTSQAELSRRLGMNNSSSLSRWLNSSYNGDVEKIEKALEEYFRAQEAAEEIAVQLRLRNLSGIIVVDFIDMKEKAQNEELMRRLRQCLAADPVKTVLVDMTPLGLVEIARKKTLRPLHEQFSRSEKNR